MILYIVLIERFALINLLMFYLRCHNLLQEMPGNLEGSITTIVFPEPELKSYQTFLYPPSNGGDSGPLEIQAWLSFALL